MFTLAHLSDPHLGPLPDLKFSQLMSKRFFGYRNWKRNRHKVHDMDILARAVQDIKSQNIEHVALTGDLVNISLPMEFLRARKWLDDFGKADWISVIPGNHDVYVPINWKQGLGLWQDYMSSNKAGRALCDNASAFPYVRIFGKIALIGMNSGAVFPPLLARGSLGEAQMRRTEEILTKLGGRGFYRVVMIHHPPVRGQNVWRKALKERNAFQDLLRHCGAELVLHGHNHLDMYRALETHTGLAHIFGVPSASASGYGHKPAAGYHIYHISGDEKAWSLNIEKRAINIESGEFETVDRIKL